MRRAPITAVPGERSTVLRMELISGYMLDSSYRHMLNDLTQKTFGFDFEDWVTNGFFEGDYIPYSFEEDGKIVSNVSANRMEFMQNGSLRHYIQIGTVMTDEAYRRRGLAAKLIKHVISEYEGRCDGIYLFGNLNATGFYQKMGFDTENQYRYRVKKGFCSQGKEKSGFRAVKDGGDELRDRYLDLVRNSAPQSSFEQLNRYGLQMFYTAGLDDVYYSDDLDCFIVSDMQGECTVLKSVLCGKRMPLEEILRRMDTGDGGCLLGYVPMEEDMYLCEPEEYDGSDDYRLFYLGEALRSIERDRLYFPELSHA